ncbi:MAG: tyrosine transporter [Chlamydiia bacterium]|nr:tyrosine transporter [Chlamydiia bacterium]
MESRGKILGGVLLVAGTTIGAAILALPVTTGLMGFYPSLALFILYWLMMTYSALLFLEVNLWLPDENVNIISMAKATLGGWGEAVAWILYLMLLYTLTTAYMAVSGPLFIKITALLTGWDAPPWFGPLPLLFIFSFFVWEGAKYVDWVNRIFMALLAATFVILNLWLIPYVDTAHFAHVDLGYLPLTVALIATSFGYHIIIPTLTRYLHRDKGALLKVILIGGAVPFVVNALWEVMTLGVIPLPTLIEGYKGGQDAVQLIVGIIEDRRILVVGQIFLFCAIVTSFLGVSLSLRDFLADGLGIKKTALGRWILYFLTFVPPLGFALTTPRAFFNALDFAGAFGVILLLVMLPVLMVWSGRYCRGFDSSRFRAPGGRVLMCAVLTLSLVIVVFEICNKLGVFKLP